MDATTIEKIEAYLEGRLPRPALEAGLSEEERTGLDEQIEWVRAARLAVEAGGLERQLDELLPRTARQEATVRPLWRRRAAWLAAASLALLLIGYGVVQVLQAPRYDSYAYLDPGLPSLMSEADNYALADAMTYYSEADYATAATKLRSLYNPTASNDTVAYYLGASLLYQDSFQVARPLLETVATRGKPPFRQRAEWLLVQSSLQAGETNAARRALSPILDQPGHPFFEQAESLRRELLQ